MNTTPSQNSIKKKVSIFSIISFSISILVLTLFYLRFLPAFPANFYHFLVEKFNVFYGATIYSLGSFILSLLLPLIACLSGIFSLRLSNRARALLSKKFLLITKLLAITGIILGIIFFIRFAFLWYLVSQFRL